MSGILRVAGVAALGLVVQFAPASAIEPYVEIVASRVNIRTAPRLSATVVTRARRGDVFRLLRRRGRWFEIEMFSGEPRYVFAKLARPTARVSGHVPPSTRDRLRQEIRRALERARREAAREIPLGGSVRNPDRLARRVDKAVSRELLLVDRYVTEVFHRLGIPPAACARLEEYLSRAVPGG